MDCWTQELEAVRWESAAVLGEDRREVRFLTLRGSSVLCACPCLFADSLLVVQRESSYTVLLLSLASSWASASCPHRPCVLAFGASLPLCLFAQAQDFDPKAFQIWLFGRGCVQEGQEKGAHSY